MTKQEKIQEAWIGVVEIEKFNEIKDFILDNGFSKIGKYYWLKNNFEIDFIKDNFYVTIEIDADKIFRPKTLKGIENNNGWIKIESEDDLPNDDYGLYYVYTKENIFCKEPKNQNIEEFWGNDENKINWWMSNVTHYQPIIKPKQPLY